MENHIPDSLFDLNFESYQLPEKNPLSKTV